MARLFHGQPQLSTSTPTILTIANDEETTSSSVSVSIQNIDAAAIVYIGDATVSSTSYGMKLVPGAVATLDQLSATMDVYGVSSVANSKVATITIQR